MVADCLCPALSAACSKCLIRAFRQLPWSKQPTALAGKVGMHPVEAVLLNGCLLNGRRLLSDCILTDLSQPPPQPGASSGQLWPSLQSNIATVDGKCSATLAACIDVTYANLLLLARPGYYKQLQPRCPAMLGQGAHATVQRPKLGIPCMLCTSTHALPAVLVAAQAPSPCCVMADDL